VSQCNFANAAIDHIRGYGVKLSREDWAGMRLWLQKSAEELEAWSREQERGACANEVLKVDPTNGAVRVIASRLRRAKESTCGVCHYVQCVCPR
jgi:hypothetical protein